MAQELKEGIDYYINAAGLFVFTEAYHLKRGYCCKNGCLHCPWKKRKADSANDRDRQEGNP